MRCTVDGVKGQDSTSVFSLHFGFDDEDSDLDPITGKLWIGHLLHVPSRDYHRGTAIVSHLSNTCAIPLFGPPT